MGYRWNIEINLCKKSFVNQKRWLSSQYIIVAVIYDACSTSIRVKRQVRAIRIWNTRHLQILWLRKWLEKEMRMEGRLLKLFMLFCGCLLYDDKMPGGNLSHSSPSVWHCRPNTFFLSVDFSAIQFSCHSALHQFIMTETREVNLAGLLLITPFTNRFFSFSSLQHDGKLFLLPSNIIQPFHAHFHHHH